MAALVDDDEIELRADADAGPVALEIPLAKRFPYVTALWCSIPEYGTSISLKPSFLNGYSPK